MTETEIKPTTDAPQVSLESAIEHAKRAFALKKYEDAVDHYATALELITEKLGDKAPETADLYFAYGKALLENAISQSSVIGKEQPEGAGEDEAAPSGTNGPIISFSGDAEDAEEDTVLDLSAVGQEGDEDEEEGEDDDAEPEDDFNAAWEVLDLARKIYDDAKNENPDDKESALKLADVYILLGDVSLETEKFDQAITDYEAGLALKTELLSKSSRQLAEAHYKLGIVLDMTSGRLADAISHTKRAYKSIEQRIAELLEAAAKATSAPNSKGKGKASGLDDDDISNLTAAQIQSELKDLKEVQTDLLMKIDELKTSPNDAVTDAPGMAAEALDRALNGNAGPSVPVAVNDLSTMVRKKKKAQPEAEAEPTPSKRKAEEPPEEAESSSEKKAKTDV